MPARLRANVRSIDQAMAAAVEMEKNSGWPEKYYWQAVWWRLESRKSGSCYSMMYSRNLVRLVYDIRLFKDYYLKKPKNKTDYEWFNLRR